MDRKAFLKNLGLVGLGISLSPSLLATEVPTPVFYTHNLSLHYPSREKFLGFLEGLDAFLNKRNQPNFLGMDLGNAHRGRPGQEEIFFNRWQALFDRGFRFFMSGNNEWELGKNFPQWEGVVFPSSKELNCSTIQAPKSSFFDLNFRANFLHQKGQNKALIYKLMEVSKLEEKTNSYLNTNEHNFLTNKNLTHLLPGLSVRENIWI